jgi:hypothetical protein
MATMHLSYPVDHHDMWIQQRFKDNEISVVFSQFKTGLVTASNLRRLGDQLAPSKQAVKAANKIVDKIISMLGGCDLFSIDRCCVSGSFGKRTALSNFDIDLIIFVNNEAPPFKSVLSELENHLRRVVPGIEIRRSTRISVQFIMDGFKVDLLPAPNLVYGPVASKTSEQYARSMEKIKAIPAKDIVKEVRIWSPALAETTVEFMKNWKASCQTLSSTFPVWFSSFLVEIIAADAAKTELEDHPNDASLVRVLEHFLMALSKPDQLRVVMTENECPAWIAKQRPLVLDPVNPYCNIALQLRDWSTIRLLAVSTLDTLSKAGSSSSPILIPDLFMPQLGSDIPAMFKWCNFQLRFALDGSWTKNLQVRKIEDLRGRRMNPGVEWRSQDRLDPRVCPEDAQRRILDTFNAFVNVSTTALLHHVSQKRQNGTGEVVAAAAFVDTMLCEVFGKVISAWVPTSETHESRDVTFTFGQVPIASHKDDLRYIFLELSANLEDARIYRVAYDIMRDLERKREEEEDAAC